MGHLGRGARRSLSRPAAAPCYRRAMSVPLMDPSAQWAAVADRVKARIGEVVDSGRFILGPLVREAESDLAARVGAAHGVGVANGTDALVIALQALGLEPGDEVICPAYTFYATAEAIVAGGRRAGLRGRARRHPLPRSRGRRGRRHAAHPRAVMPVHLFGHPADAPALRAICDRHGLLLVEDAAQAFGASLGGHALRRVRRRRDVLVLPHQEPARVRRRRPDHDLRRRRRRARAHPALPRLEGQGHVRADRLQLAARRAAGGGAARARTARRRLEPAAAPRPRRATPSSASASSPSCRTSAPGATHIYHLYMVRTPQRDALVGALKRARRRRRRLLRAPAAPAAGVRAPRLPRGLAARDRAGGARGPRAADVPDARRRSQQAEVVDAVRAASAVARLDARRGCRASTSCAGRRACTRPRRSPSCSSTRCPTRRGLACVDAGLRRGARHRRAAATRRARGLRVRQGSLRGRRRPRRTSRGWRPTRSARGSASAASPSSSGEPCDMLVCNPPQRPKALWADLQRAGAAAVLRRRRRRARAPSGWC